MIILCLYCLAAKLPLDLIGWWEQKGKPAILLSSCSRQEDAGMWLPRIEHNIHVSAQPRIPSFSFGCHCVPTQEMKYIIIRTDPNWRGRKTKHYSAISGLTIIKLITSILQNWLHIMIKLGYLKENFDQTHKKKAMLFLIVIELLEKKKSNILTQTSVE